MIIVVKKSAGEEAIRALAETIQDMGYGVQRIQGYEKTVLGVVGDTARLDAERIKSQPIVETIHRVTEAYPLAGRHWHPADTVVEIGSVKIGGGHFAWIAGPCAVENEKQILSAARGIKQAGGQLLRGGAFKPRTSPYAFQGLGAEGIKLLLAAKAETGLPIVTEIMDVRDLPLFEQVDVIQVGARNMQNFELLKELGALRRPVLLKRGPSATIQEWLLSAEYLLAGGNSQVMLCERGIRTFETATRNTMDIAAIPLLHRLTHLPVLADPSHATGSAALVQPMALAATAAGADGLMVEVHPQPETAQSDGAQALDLKAYAEAVRAVAAIRPHAFSAGGSHAAH